MIQKRHILFISSWYPNRNNPLHGIFNRYFAEAAADYNEVSVLHVSSEEDLKTEFEIQVHDADGIFTTHVYYRKVKSKIPLLSSLQKRKKLLEGFRLGYEEILKSKRKPHLIQLNVVMPAGIGAYDLSVKESIPLIVNENWSGYMPEDGNYKGKFLKHFTRKIISHAKMIMPTSSILKDAMLAHGLKGNYRVIPNVVDTQKFRILPVQKQNHTQFIHISTLDDNPKNISGILRAFSSTENKEAKLLIVGNGPEAQKHIAYSKELSLQDRVKFLGTLQGDELVRAINESDALLMFSLYETFSLVMAEAMACGKPVISSKVGIARDLPGDCGMVVKVGDERALTKAVDEFIRRKKAFDPEQIRAHVLKHFAGQVVSKALNDVYEEVLK